MKTDSAVFRTRLMFQGAMNEKLLQYIWQHQCFNRTGLTTISGEPVSIEFPGVLNKDQGPDFLGARLRIGKIIFVGAVEIHVRTQQWVQHGHSDDINYKNVVLHVVWEHGGNVPARIPVVELSGRVPGLLLEKYRNLMESPFQIPCGRAIASVPSLIFQAWKDRLVMERLAREANTILARLEKNAFHWEESFWHRLAGNFGTKVNKSAFESVGASLPLSLLEKLSYHPLQIEALLMGQAGLLTSKENCAYQQELVREYQFLSAKHQLQAPSVQMHFLRMRPMNFPTVRMAQLASFVPLVRDLFELLLHASDLKAMKNKLEICASEYWNDHYRFGETSKFFPKAIGDSMIANICINTLIPFLYTYGSYHGQTALQEKAINWLASIPHEDNRICRGFLTLGITASSAADSQALLELQTSYCSKKKCLACAVGSSLLKNAPS